MRLKVRALGGLQLAVCLCFGLARCRAGSSRGLPPPVPGMVAHFHLTDAVFQPRIASRVAAARQEASRATANDVLLETALAYLDLLRGNQGRAIAEETLTHAQQLADLTATFARTGQGPQADADRAEAALAVFKNPATRAQEEVGVSAARLNELLRLDPTRPSCPASRPSYRWSWPRTRLSASTCVRRSTTTRPSSDCIGRWVGPFE